MLSLYPRAAVGAPCVCVFQRVCRWFQRSVGTCIRQTGNDPDVNGGVGGEGSRCVVGVTGVIFVYTRPLAVLCYLRLLILEKRFSFSVFNTGWLLLFTCNRVCCTDLDLRTKEYLALACKLTQFLVKGRLSGLTLAH